MISLKSVSVEIEGTSILRDLSLDLDQKRIGVVGLNGSGKSTFARLLNGLQLPTTGTVLVAGNNTKTEGKAVRRNVGFVFQNPENQIVYPTVREDLAFGLKNLKKQKDHIANLVTTSLEKYDLLHLVDNFTHHLSGGEKQMIALIGVMIMEPDYIVFDEPTTLLDLRNKRKLMSVVETLKQSVLMVTHDLDLLERFDRVLCFHEGQLAIDDIPSVAISKYLEICEA